MDGEDLHPQGQEQEGGEEGRKSKARQYQEVSTSPRGLIMKPQF